MINEVSIKYLYKHTKRPKDGFPVTLLEEVERKCAEHFDLSFEDGLMVIGSLSDSNPFKRIRMSCIKGFEIIDCEVAAVIDHCIIFFNNADGTIKVNMKKESMPFWRRVAEPFRRLFRRKCDPE